MIGFIHRDYLLIKQSTLKRNSPLLGVYFAVTPSSIDYHAAIMTAMRDKYCALGLLSSFSFFCSYIYRTPSLRILCFTITSNQSSSISLH